MRIAAALTIGLAMASLAIAQQSQQPPVAPVPPVAPPSAFGVAWPNTQTLPRLSQPLRMSPSAERSLRTTVSGFSWPHAHTTPGATVWGNYRIEDTELQKRSAKATQSVSKAKKMLKSESADDRAQGKSDLTDALTELFDVMTDSREEQIEELEKRLDTMREQLEERSSQKRQIVELKLQTIVNDANGMTF